MEPQKTRGHFHPISILINDIARIFTDMGFDIEDGPELETEYYNFDALNIPKDHPSRDMQDTFWVKTPKTQANADQTQNNVEVTQKNAKETQKNTPENLRPSNSASSPRPSALLRTHTSPVQIRYMESKMKAGILPPYAIVVPGKVFRNEATDATHEAQFFQVEGLLVGKDVTLGILKGVLEKFFSELFGGPTPVRFRTSFFPFVEPGVEVDMQCFRCGGGLHLDVMPEGKLRERVKAEVEKDIKKTNRDLGIETTLGQETIYTLCSVCRGSGWIEIMGAGMVHPKVLEAVGVDPKKYQGFAFGGGIDRIAMLKWGIDDVRLLYNGDLRVVNQF